MNFLEDRTIIADFWALVRKDGPDHCWPWLRPLYGNGYGMHFFTYCGIQYRFGAHRFAYMAEHKIVLNTETYICHTCDNKACCNPSHLFAGTQKDNMQDMLSKGRGNQAKGEKHHRAILSEDQVRSIKLRLGLGLPCKEIAQHFGVSITTIHHIASRRNWKHVV